MSLTTYKNLIVWQKSIDLVQMIYELTKSFPQSETFGLVSQMRRASVSIPSNIAEGRLRGIGKQYRQFLLFAFGSCGELQTQLEIAKRMGYCRSIDEAEKSIDEIMRIFHTIIGQQNEMKPFNLQTS